MTEKLFTQYESFKKKMEGLDRRLSAILLLAILIMAKLINIDYFGEENSFIIAVSSCLIWIFLSNIINISLLFYMNFLKGELKEEKDMHEKLKKSFLFILLEVLITLICQIALLILLFKLFV